MIMTKIFKTKITNQSHIHNHINKKVIWTEKLYSNYYENNFLY